MCTHRGKEGWCFRPEEEGDKQQGEKRGHLPDRLHFLFWQMEDDWMGNIDAMKKKNTNITKER